MFSMAVAVTMKKVEPPPMKTQNKETVKTTLSHGPESGHARL